MDDRTLGILGGVSKKAWDTETAKDLIASRIGVGMTDVIVPCPMTAGLFWGTIRLSHLQYDVPEYCQ